jgi:hypothetical protein
MPGLDPFDKYLRVIDVMNEAREYLLNVTGDEDIANMLAIEIFYLYLAQKE